jgi:rubrerythrin
MLSGFIEDVETMAQLEAIIAEERCHLQALRALAKRISV